MPAHIAINSVAIANVANTDAPAIDDDVLTILNGHHVPRADARLLASYAGAVTMTRARLNTPYAMQTTPIYLFPLATTLLPVTRPQVNDFRRSPILLRQNEEVVWELTDSAAGPNNARVVSWWDMGITPAPTGPVYQFLGTSITAAVAGAWSTIVVTWNNVLPAGRYAVVGGKAYSATGIAFSLIFQGQYDRPGGLMFATVNLVEPEIQIDGGTGLWGVFDTLTLPKIRVFCDAADAVFTVVLQIIRLS